MKHWQNNVFILSLKFAKEFEYCSYFWKQIIALDFI